LKPFASSNEKLQKRINKKLWGGKREITRWGRIKYTMLSGNPGRSGGRFRLRESRVCRKRRVYENSRRSELGRTKGVAGYMGGVTKNISPRAEWGRVVSPKSVLAQEREIRRDIAVTKKKM